MFNKKLTQTTLFSKSYFKGFLLHVCTAQCTKMLQHEVNATDYWNYFVLVPEQFAISLLQVNSSSRRARVKEPEPTIEIIEIDTTHSTLRPTLQSLGTFRSGSLPNVAAPQATNAEPEQKVPIFWNLISILYVILIWYWFFSVLLHYKLQSLFFLY